MPDFIYHANIDHYLELLYDIDLATPKRAMVVKLLIEEEDKLARYQEQLEFAETRLAKSRDRVNHFSCAMVLRTGLTTANARIQFWKALKPFTSCWISSATGSVSRRSCAVSRAALSGADELMRIKAKRGEPRERPTHGMAAHRDSSV
jgi:hypothetical protein